MVLEALGSTLSLAVGIMISPLPMIAIFIVLMAPKARSNGVAFTAGWALSVLGLIYICISLGQGFQNNQPTSGEGILQTILGAAFLYLGFKEFRTSYQSHGDPKLPGWMKRAEKLSFFQAFMMGAILDFVNVKNIPLAAQAIVVVRPLNLNLSQQWITAIGFALIASLPFLVPTIWLFLDGEGARKPLGQARDFLERHNHLVMGALFLIMGSQAIGGGIQVIARNTQA